MLETGNTSGAGLRLMGWRRSARHPGPLLILSSARASGRVSKDRPAGGNASLDTRLAPLLGMRGKRTGADGRGALAIGSDQPPPV